MLNLPSQLKKITEGFRRHAHNCTQAMNQKEEDCGHCGTDGLWVQ